MLKKLKSIKSCLYISSYQRERERDKKILSDTVNDGVRYVIKRIRTNERSKLLLRKWCCKEKSSHARMHLHHSRCIWVNLRSACNSHLVLPLYSPSFISIQYRATSRFPIIPSLHITFSSHPLRLPFLRSSVINFFTENLFEQTNSLFRN